MSDFLPLPSSSPLVASSSWHVLFFSYRCIEWSQHQRQRPHCHLLLLYAETRGISPLSPHLCPGPVSLVCPSSCSSPTPCTESGRWVEGGGESWCWWGGGPVYCCWLPVVACWVVVDLSSPPSPAPLSLPQPMWERGRGQAGGRSCCWSSHPLFYPPLHGKGGGGECDTGDLLRCGRNESQLSTGNESQLSTDESQLSLIVTLILILFPAYRIIKN